MTPKRLFNRNTRMSLVQRWGDVFSRWACRAALKLGNDANGARHVYHDFWLFVIFGTPYYFRKWSPALRIWTRPKWSHFPLLKMDSWSAAYKSKVLLLYKPSNGISSARCTLGIVMSSSAMVNSMKLHFHSLLVIRFRIHGCAKMSGGRPQVVLDVPRSELHDVMHI